MHLDMKIGTKIIKMKIFNIVSIILFVGVIGFIIYRVNTTDKIQYKTTNISKGDISNVIHIPGNVYPTKEIQIKSQLSGILDAINVKIGDHVNVGSPIASIRLVANISDIDRLETKVNNAQIEYNARLTEYERARRLH